MEEVKLRVYRCTECKNVDKYAHNSPLADCSRCGAISRELPKKTKT